MEGDKRTICNFWSCRPTELRRRNWWLGIRPIAPIGQLMAVLSCIFELISDADNSDEISLGTVTRRMVLNDSGKIEIQTNADDLAGLLFDGNDKVRCLVAMAGGSFLRRRTCTFHARSRTCPQQSQLFALDPRAGSHRRALDSSSVRKVCRQK